MDPEGVEAESCKDGLEPLLKTSSNWNEAESKKAHETAGPLSHQLHYPSCGYVCGQRPCNDVVCAVTFAIFVLASIILGIFSIVNYNSEYGLTDSALYNSSSGLCYVSYGYGGFPWEFEDFKQESNLGRVIRRVKTLKDHISKQGVIQMSSERRQEQSISGDLIVVVLIWTLAVTFVLTVPLVCGLLWLLKAFAKQLVYACLPLFIVISVFLNIVWFMACTVTFECQEAVSLAGRIALFVFVFILCGIFSWIIYCKWYCVELTIRIMQTAAEALLRNWGLLLVLPSLTIALLIYIIPFAVFLFYSSMNGRIVTNSETYCKGDAATDCCKWRIDRWVPAYYALTIFTVLWSVLMMTEAQVYIISGTIAQWYFTATSPYVAGRIRRSLWNAFGPCFGTCSFSGLIVSFVCMIRAIVDISHRGQNQRGCSFVIGRCCMKFILFAIEFLNKFTINFAAITGENYCVSARMSYDLLKRNLLSLVFVEAIPTRLLVAGIVFVLSTVYAIVLCAILRTATTLGGAAYYITVLVWIVLLMLLFLLSHILDKVIDTIYICYAIDKDSGAVSKQEVHDVYLMLPASCDQLPTLAIQQP